MKYGGSWWLAGSPGWKVDGHLSLVDDQWELSVVGQLDAQAMTVREPGYGIDSRTVVGDTTKGLVSLLDCHLASQAGGSIRNQPRRTQTWRATELIAGREVSPTQLYSKTTFQMDGLTEWWESPTKRIRLSSADEADLEKVNAGRKPLTIRMHNGWSLTLNSTGTERSGVHEASYERRTSVLIEYAAGFTSQEVYGLAIFPLQAMLTTAFGTEIVLREENLFLVGADPETGWVKVGVGKLGTEPPPDQFAFARPLFTSADVNPQSFLEAWLMQANDLIFPLGWINEHRLGRRTLQVDAMSSVMAAETLHRKIHGTTYDVDQVDRLMAVLGESDQFISEERRDARNALKRGYEQTLPQRLAQLASDLGDPTADYLLGGELKAWAQVAAGIRNTLGHGLQPKHQLHRNYPAMLMMTVVTTMVLELAIAVSCGLPGGEWLKSRVAGLPRYRSAAEQRVVSWKALLAQPSQ